MHKHERASRLRTTPPAELEISEALIRELLREQAPHWVDMTLEHVADGWDNSTWRLGRRLAVRLPRRQAAVVCLENEQRWLATVATGLTIEVPTIKLNGRPSTDYPWPWSVVPWFRGETAARCELGDGAATPLASILRQLHRPAPAEAPRNPYRGVALQQRRAAFTERLETLSEKLEEARRQNHGPSITNSHLLSQDRGGLEAAFSAGEASTWTDQPVWLHGDLHPKNVLVREQRVTALLDWGDLCAGDPASDLACMWMLLPRRLHPRFKAAYGEANGLQLWTRARGWAVLFGVLFYLAGIDGDDEFSQIGANTLRRALDS